MVHSPSVCSFSGLEIPRTKRNTSIAFVAGCVYPPARSIENPCRKPIRPAARWCLLHKVVDGALPISHKLTDQMYRCLDCLACNAICPVGIRPADLALQARYLIHQARPQPWIKPLIFRGYFPHARLMELSMLPMLAYQRLGLQKFGARPQAHTALAGSASRCRADAAGGTRTTFAPPVARDHPGPWAASIPGRFFSGMLPEPDLCRGERRPRCASWRKMAVKW